MTYLPNQHLNVRRRSSHRRHLTRAHTIIGLGLGLACCHAARAQSFFTFTGGPKHDGHAWEAAGDWDLNSVPGFGDYVEINEYAGGGQNLVIKTGGTIDTANIDLTGSAVLEFSTNTNLNSNLSYFGTSLYLDTSASTGTTLTFGAGFSMAGTYLGVQNYNGGSSPNTLLINNGTIVDTYVTGTPTTLAPITAIDVNLANNGVITASTGGAISFGGTTLTNNGSISQGGAAALYFGTISTMINNAGGTISATGGGATSIYATSFTNNGTIGVTGGTLDGLSITAGNGAVNLNGVTTGRINFYSTGSNTLTISNGLSLLGSAGTPAYLQIGKNTTFNYDSLTLGNGAYLELSNNRTLSNPISINSADGATNACYIALDSSLSTGTTLTIANGMTLSGNISGFTSYNGGNGGAGAISVTNNGTITNSSTSTTTNFDVNTTTNNGTISATSGGIISTGSSLTVTNNGTISQSGSGALRIGSNSTVINNAGATISATGGGLLAFSGSITNNGTITQTGSGGVMNIAGGSLINSGTVNIGAGTSANLNSASSTQTAGATIVNGEMTLGSAYNLQGGTLYGSGTIVGNLNNSGATVGAGQDGATPSAGKLTLTGNYAQSAGATFSAAIGGTGQGTDYDLFTVSGTTTLGGLLDIDLLGNFAPTSGETFQIIHDNGSTGAFSNATGNTITDDSGKYLFQITYGSSGVSLMSLGGPDATPEPAAIVLLLISGGPFAFRTARTRSRRAEA